MEPAAYVVDQLKSGALKFAVEDPEAEENHPRILSLWRANLLGSSAKGNEYFLKHLLGTDNAVTAAAGPAGEAPRGHRVARRGARGQARPAHDHRLPDDELDAVLRRRAAGRHLVREARHQHHRHAPVRALLQPGHRPAVAVEDRLGGVEGGGEEVLRARRRPPRHPSRRRREAAVARHPRGHGHRPRRRQGLAHRRGRAGARARPCRCSPSPSATTPRSTTR